MRSKSFIAVAAFIVVLLFGAIGVYAYDSKREDVIAEGITVGGVDIGGMRAAEAKDKLRGALLEPLNQPVVVKHQGKRFTLTPEQARIGVNVDSSVAQALDESREGGFFTRTVRGLTGGEVDQDVDVQVTYDQDAVRRLVAKARRKLERDPVDAAVSFDGGQVARTPARKGLKVAATRLERKIERRLTSATMRRTVTVPTAKVAPKVTMADLAEKYPAAIIVNRGAFQLQLYKDLEPVKTYTVAVGQAGLETPQGLYEIQNMAVNPYWHVPQSDWAGSLAGQVIPPGPSNPIKARWMGIYNGAGIHGTDAVGSLGTAASHGCIRMAIPDVEELYEQVDVGTPVYIL
jgi:lipoprotein-anchoring transpeptidase ErfK/SrfK